MSDNWVVQNLENALETWNDKLSEIWRLLTTTPQDFKGGSIWNVMVTINGAVQAIGLALLVLFFVVGVVRTCGSFTDVKKPEHALKLFVRFAIAKGVITYGMELMLALFNIVQGIISTIMTSSGFGTPNQTTLPSEMVTTIEDCGFFESIPLWAVTLIGGLFITVLSFILIMTVYGRFFKLYMYTALAPIHIRDNTLCTRQWQTKIDLPTQSPMVLAKRAFQLFEARYGWYNPIRSVTILIPQDTPRQIGLFMDVEKQEKLERLEKCIETIRRRFGKDSIRNGVLYQDLQLPPEKVEITMPTGMVG